eukprot:TRINITY_DN71797_c0_g1_i1.p1 TRINITY_DN71797_c0_g1~~TRINITY_DN71797_c0_g1_i1.p1  ORF type:complete len:192 (+),score=56.70 TRINITY_DN71797_c0_g1_i1:66-641(+)
MTAIFDDIASRHYQPFSLDALTEDQEACYEFTREVAARVVATRGRDKYNCELICCVGGLGPGDETEALDRFDFSAEAFWRVYAEELVSMEEKFDFLLHCIESNVCVVAEGFCERYMALLSRVLEPETPQPADARSGSIIPEAGEGAQPSDPARWKEELRELEAEQHAAEESRRPRVFPHWRPCTEPGSGYP